MQEKLTDAVSTPGSGRSPGGGHGNPSQYSCLENPMDRGAWWATVHRVAKSWTWLKRLRRSGRVKCMSFRLTSFGSSEILLCFLQTYIRRKNQLNKIMWMVSTNKSLLISLVLVKFFQILFLSKKLWAL